MVTLFLTKNNIRTASLATNFQPNFLIAQPDFQLQKKIKKTAPNPKDHWLKTNGYPPSNY